MTSANGVVTTYAMDPNHMARPASITTTANPAWSSGAYAYDGAGNVTRIGIQGRFLYDGVSRLVQGVTVITPADSTTTASQTVGYDLYGNIQSINTNGSIVATPTNSANRLTSPGVSYDTAGSLTGWNGASYHYDALGLLWHYTSGAEDWLYMYTADDERVWAFRTAGSGNFWAIRDLDGKVLREYDANAGWSIHRDYVYRGDKLLSAVTPQGTRHFHLDHLGSVRQVTGSTTAQEEPARRCQRPR